MAWLLDGWGVYGLVTARSGYPFTVYSSTLFVPGFERFRRRASLVPDVPIIIKDASAPGGQRFNRAAFTEPPAGEQGNTDRNAFRGFAAYQADLAVQRVIPLKNGINLRVRVDAFNLVNHPVFALPSVSLTSSSFGVPTSSAASVTGSLGTLYQAGGPRTVALSARVEF
jgi:hypothetical protein